MAQAIEIGDVAVAVPVHSYPPEDQTINSVNQWSTNDSDGVAMMSGQKYKRTNFEEDDNTSTGGTPPGVTYDPNIAFKAGATFWQRRSLLEKFLIAFSIILVLVVIILGTIVGTRKSVTRTFNITTITKPDYCTTQACVTLASALLNSMDQTADPCDDFYQYACGGWVKSHPIPSGQSRWGTFSVMDKQNQIIIMNELDSKKDTPSEAEKKARIYFRSCMDPNKTVDALGAKPLLDILKSLGGWAVSPRAGDWDISNYNLQTLVEDVHNLGMAPLFYMGVGEDEKNTESNILLFDQSGLGLPRDQYLNKSIDDDKILSAYLTFMTEVGVLLGGSQNDTRDQMRAVIEFEQELANITTPMEERRDDEKLYHKMPVSQLGTIAPFLDWVQYLNKQLSVTTYTVDSSENVIVYAPEYLKRLTALLDTMQDDEGKQVLSNYMIWQVVKSLCAYLSKPFQNARKEFMEVLSGVNGEEELWRYCTSDTNSVLGFAVGAMFVRNTFHGESKDKAEEMIAGIKSAFIANLDNLKWMDSPTRVAAIEKANAVVDMIGFPAFIHNVTALDERYKQLKVNESEYFQNNMRALAYNIKRNLDKLRKKPEKYSWSMTPATVNAYYTPTKNEIVFPAGILQAPFFDQEYPKSINYGGMGVVMGHELTHGFDDQGREYDKMGVLRPWWNNASIERFKVETQCMIDQYSSFKINDDNVRGKQTLGENIADNGGLKASYHAYEKWVSKQGEEPPLPGVNLTHRQLFFLAFSQVWCSNSKPESQHMGILTDPHSPSKFRVIGPLSNSRDFAAQFQCKAGSKMNPIEKCEVW